VKLLYIVKMAEHSVILNSFVSLYRVLKLDINFVITIINF
jgi:hypothetical protein